MKKLTDEQKKLLLQVVENYWDEDRVTRERQIKSWRKYKLLWDGFTRVYYSEVAHDWRIYDGGGEEDDQQDHYDKPVNVFRAYLESIIAALSVAVPPIKCFPDDADNGLDLLTAKAGDKIAELIQKHNDATLLWIHGLFIYCTEGMTAAYNYTKEDEKYGTYKEQKFEDTEESHDISTCPTCGGMLDEKLSQQLDDKFSPDEQDVEPLNIAEQIPEFCPTCQADVIPLLSTDKVVVSRLVGQVDKPKARQCIEVYGGLYVKVANYAKCQGDTPYLYYSYETNFALARERYSEIRDKIGPGNSTDESYEKWGRNNPQYFGEYPSDSVTVRNCWLRPSAFQFLADVAEVEELKKLFPSGAKVVMVNDELAEAVNESLDDHWTLTHNPLSDFLYFDPAGASLVSVQEIINDLISLIIQTIEHGIPQTFFDPRFLNAKAYREMEAIPGGMYPTNPIQSGKTIKDGFYEVKTATLSQEVMPFVQQVQEFGQLVSGALPSIFGGQVAGSGTASEYSMSKTQATQRLQNVWKMFTVWWKTIFGKVIPAYIKTVQEDERIVKKDDFGNFVNVLIRKAELEGKIGSVELEANENLPINWAQRRDVIMKLLETNNQQLLALIAQPENLHLLYEALGVVDLYVPGEDDRIKQFDEIKELLATEPIQQPPDEMAMMESAANGMPAPPPIETPSVEVDPIMDNHEIEFEICRKWAISEAGRQAKKENEAGYKNVLLHAMMHKQIMIQEQMQQAMQQQQQEAPLGKPKQDKQAPITEESDVQTA